MSDSSGNFIEKIIAKVKIYLVIIIILCIILCIYDLHWIIPSLVLVIILSIYTFLENSKKKNELVNHIEEITMDVSTTSKNTLVNSPIPLVIIETDGSIIWRSKKFTETFVNVEMSTYLNLLVKEIKLDIENNHVDSFEKTLNINGRNYKIEGTVSGSKRKGRKKSQEYVLVLYFIDNTEYSELFNKYNNESTCIGIAVIDNYDDIIQRALPEEKLELVAGVEKMIRGWATESSGLIVKNERNIFIYIFEKQYLSNMEKDKFNVLDKVKSLETNSKIPVTISIAVTNDGKNNYEKYRNALTSLEMVLGRGGDQAVVRKEGKYKFYGGKSLETEKRTKVKARNVAKSISNAILESKNILIMGHQNIDIDAIRFSSWYV